MGFDGLADTEGDRAVKHVLGLSGGKDSTCLALAMREYNPHIDMEYICTPTGNELPELFAHLDHMETLLGKPIKRLGIGKTLHQLIDDMGMLPNFRARWCTRMLKIEPTIEYMQALPAGSLLYVGLRADEPHRLSKPQRKDRWLNWYPLAVAGVSRSDVSDFWAAQDFDLRLPNVKGNCWLGNCDGCFLKSEASIASLSREFPDRAKWWENIEEELVKTRGDGGVWSLRYRRKSLREFMEKQGDWALSTEGALCQVNDGECTG